MRFAGLLRRRLCLLQVVGDDDEHGRSMVAQHLQIARVTAHHASRKQGPLVENGIEVRAIEGRQGHRYGWQRQAMQWRLGQAYGAEVQTGSGRGAAASLDNSKSSAARASGALK